MAGGNAEGPVTVSVGGGVRWTYAFVDRPVVGFARAREFWTAVTATTPSAPRGDDGEFVTLLPESGTRP